MICSPPPAPRSSHPAPLDYRTSGVDIDAAQALVERVRPMAARTHTPAVLGGLGGFAALYELPREGFVRPVLVSATDGVGTKLKLAEQLGRHDTIGVDLVAMCVNDVVACGAKPLYFLDYIASGRLDVAQAAAVIEGIARGCGMAECALVGGETAELPGMYGAGEYDLAGFAVGIAEKDRLPDPAKVRVGDVLLGLASSGAHANGYSLIRKILDVSGAELSDPFGATTLGEALLEPTRIYARAIGRLLAQVAVPAMAHITGGGLPENLPRVLPPRVVAEIHPAAWPQPPLFEWLRAHGGVAAAEMLRTFNCGIGMVVVVAPNDREAAVAALEGAGETVFDIGHIAAGEAAARVVIRE